MGVLENTMMFLWIGVNNLSQRKNLCKSSELGPSLAFSPPLISLCTHREVKESKWDLWVVLCFFCFFSEVLVHNLSSSFVYVLPQLMLSSAILIFIHRLQSSMNFLWLILLCVLTQSSWHWCVCYILGLDSSKSSEFHTQSTLWALFIMSFLFPRKKSGQQMAFAAWGAERHLNSLADWFRWANMLPCAETWADKSYCFACSGG